MKKLNMLLVLLLVLVTTGVSLADDSAEIDVSAILDPALELSWGMARVDSKLTATPDDDEWTGNQDVMYFSVLRHTLADGTEAGTWFSKYYYAVFLSAITGGAPYRLESSSAGLNNGSTQLPKAWGVASMKCWDTVNDVEVSCPDGSSLGDAAPAEGTVTIFDSGTTDTKTVTIRADYAIPSYPDGGGDPFSGFEPIPINQAAGTYSGVVTISVVTY